MKYILTESQVGRIEKIVKNYLTDKDFKGVNDFMIDYDEQFDCFDVNIIFDKEHFISLGPLQTRFKNAAVKVIGNDLKNFFPDTKFRLYIHFGSLDY